MKYLFIVLLSLTAPTFLGCTDEIHNYSSPVTSASQYHPYAAKAADGTTIARVPEENLNDLGDQWYTDKAVGSQYGYSTYSNLAQQIYRPCDLETPEKFDGANPMAATGALERYQKGQVRALPEHNLDVGGQ